MEEYYVIFCENDDICYLGPLKLSQADFTILTRELAIYSSFGSSLLSGTAPYPCYVNPETKEKIYQNGGYSLCGFFPSLASDSLNNLREKGKSMSVDQFMHILSTPFDPSKQFSFGYGVLPGVKEILMRQ